MSKPADFQFRCRGSLALYDTLEEAMRRSVITTALAGQVSLCLNGETCGVIAECYVNKSWTRNPIYSSDLDGVLANTQHRASLPRKGFDNVALIDKDTQTPFLPMFVDVACRACCFVLSGRPESLRRVTTDWLQSYGVVNPIALREGTIDNYELGCTSAFKLSMLYDLAARARTRIFHFDDEIIAHSSDLTLQGIEHMQIRMPIC